MNFNLGHPENIEAATLARCQRVAGLWVNQLNTGKTTRQNIKRELSTLPIDEQVTIKKWLNTYYEQLKPALKPKPKPKARRVVPHWVRR